MQEETALEKNINGALGAIYLTLPRSDEALPPPPDGSKAIINAMSFLFVHPSVGGGEVIQS